MCNLKVEGEVILVSVFMIYMTDTNLWQQPAIVKYKIKYIDYILVSFAFIERLLNFLSDWIRYLNTHSMQINKKVDKLVKIIKQLVVMYVTVKTLY